MSLASLIAFILILFIAIGTFITTILGGLFALKFRNKLYLILGFSAGAVIGVAFFDLLPASIELSAGDYGIRFVTTMAGAGFMLYMVLDRVVVLFAGYKKNNAKPGKLRGNIIAACLAVHSLLDGIAIGLAFQISAAIGGMVATAVLVHDFADGINTTNVILKENGDRKNAIRWLIINAIAPVIGACSTLYYKVPQSDLGILLAVVSGFFLYIGASDFLPQSQQRHPYLITSVMTILGMATLFIVIHITHF